jgi:hypothetical protein
MGGVAFKGITKPEVSCFRLPNSCFCVSGDLVLLDGFRRVCVQGHAGKIVVARRGSQRTTTSAAGDALC